MKLSGRTGNAYDLINLMDDSQEIVDVKSYVDLKFAELSQSVISQVTVGKIGKRERSCMTGILVRLENTG